MSRKHTHAVWTLNDTLTTWDEVHTAILMDIREVLYTIRDSVGRGANHTAALQCRNAMDIPRVLRKIAANTDRYRCSAHPRYKAILPPRKDCKECRRMYRRRHP